MAPVALLPRLEGVARSLAKHGLIPAYDDYTTAWYRIHAMKPG